MDYLGHLGVLICVYAVLAASLDLLVGFTGILSLGHAAPFGLGAYAAALLLLHTPVPALVVFPSAMLAAGAVYVCIGIPGLRLKGDTFALATLGLAETLRIGAANWTAVTRGPMGLPGIPRPGFGPVALSSPAGYMVFSAVCAGLVCVLFRALVRSRMGRVLEAVRDDEEWLAALGRRPKTIKLAAMAVSGAAAGLAGALFAAYAAFVDPSAFTFSESILVLCMVILGGPGTVWGSVLGAATLVLIPEPLRFLPLPADVLGSIRQMLNGLLLVLIMLFRPRGLFGNPWVWQSLK